MKKILFILFVTSLPAHAQVDTYDYLYFSDKMMANVANSVGCLQNLYEHLRDYKKNPNTQFQYFESYNCITQPDEALYNNIKNGPNTFFKTVDNELWKLSNDCYKKNAEIIAYLRLEDYKTDIDKGLAMVREMQQMQIAMGKARDRIADKVVADAKAAPAGSVYTKPYQLLMNAIVHEDQFIRTLSQNFNEDLFVGYPRAELVKNYLELDDMLKTITSTKFSVPQPQYLKAVIEGLQLIQKTKQNSLDGFSNASTLDGLYTNTLYDNLQNYFNNDILHFYSEFCAQGRLNYYPGNLREYDFDAPAVEWPLPNVSYTPATLDSVVVTKQTGSVPRAGFNELNDIVYYVDECVRSMENIFSALRYEETWTDIRNGKMPRKNPMFKFDKVTVPVSLHAMILKEGKNIPALYRTGLINQVNDVEQIMLALQENLMDLSKYLYSGAFRTGPAGYIDTKLKTVEMLYTELDSRKEKLFLQVRKVYGAYTPTKNNSWTTTASALLRAADHSREVLRQMERRIYDGVETPVSTTTIHEDRRDLITNQFTYMKGIVRIGANSGLDPYSPYDYIPGYLETLEEKVAAFSSPVENKNKAYGDILYMHNVIVHQFNRYAEIALGENEYGTTDPMRPVYVLWYIRQPPKYHHDIPKPKEPEPEVPKEPEPTAGPEYVTIIEPISFEGYAYNNLVLLLDVSASMNKPERLPLLKESFTQLVRMMRKEDEVSIVVYSGKATLHLPPRSASDTTTIIRAIQNLRSEGTTNITDGMALAYKTANKNFIKEGNNKIIVATDGEFKVNDSILKLIGKNSEKIVLSVFDFSQLPDPLKAIQELAEKGNGNYVKVTPENSLEALAIEARKEK